MRAYVRAGGRPVEQPDQLVAVDRRVLDRHDDVGARGDRRARRDVHRLAGADGPLGLVADQRAADDLQLRRVRRGSVGDVGGSHREPVHRGRRELGEIVRGDHVLGHHAAVRVRQRQTERSEWADGAEHPLRASSTETKPSGASWSCG